MYGGAALRQFFFAEGLSKIGCHVGLIVPRGTAQLFPKDSKLSLIEAFDQNKGIRKLRWIYYRLPYTLRLIRKFKPDHIILLSGGGLLNLCLFAFSKLASIKSTVLIKNDEDVTTIETSLRQRDLRIQHQILTLCNKIVCQNEFQLKQIRTKYAQKSSMLILNPFPVAQEQLPVNQRNYVAYLGALRDLKNIPALLRIAENHPEVEFKLAGKLISGASQELLQIISRLEALNNVTFLGQLDRSEIPKFLSKAYCLINTSFYEGFPNTFLESFSAGTPIVSLFVDPNQVLSHEKLGYLVKEEAISDVLKHLIHNFDYEVFSAKAHDYLSSQHDQLIIARKLLEFIAPKN